MIASLTRAGRWSGSAPSERSRITWVEVDALVKVAHFHIARLFLVILVGELTQSFRRHTQQVDELSFVGVLHEYLDERLDEPRSLFVISDGGVTRNRRVGDHHVFPSRSGSINVADVRERTRVFVSLILSTFTSRSSVLVFVDYHALIRFLAATSLDDEKLGLAAKTFRVHVVERFVDVFGLDDASVGRVNVAVATVAEDDDDGHVRVFVFLELGKVTDRVSELLAIQILTKYDLKVELFE